MPKPLWQSGCNVERGRKIFIVNQVKLHGCKISSNPINPIFPPTPKAFNDVVVKSPKKRRCNYMKMSGYWIIGKSDKFLLVSYQDHLNTNLNLAMTETIVGIPTAEMCLRIITLQFQKHQTIVFTQR